MSELKKGTELYNRFQIEVAAALTSLDEGKIKDFCRRWRMNFPDDEDRFWTGVHVARALHILVPREKRGDSAAWLANKGINLKDFIDASPEFIHFKGFEEAEDDS